MDKSNLQGHEYLVYFSASSKFTAQDKTLATNIVRSIELSGGKVVYNWLEDQQKLSPADIYEQAVAGIQSADILVAEITYPSLGVGQQIGLALSKRMPVVALYHKDKGLASRFTLGFKSDLLHIVEYSSANLEKILKQNFKKLMIAKFAKFNFVSTKEINDYLERESIASGVSKSQLLRQIVKEKMNSEES